jgi:ubiquinone/menaquinone biosynthesis C-methylase UbiE
MGIYRDRILPGMIHRSMQNPHLRAYRSRIVPSAEGRVLEVGIGSGLNLPFYTDRVGQVIGIDPSPKLLAIATAAASCIKVPVEFVEGSAEAVPMESASVDTVLTTWTLCSIPNAQKALSDLRRVLKPGGRLLFVEHGRAPDQFVQWWQDRLTPIWRHVAGGCHLNRSIGEMIEGAGFVIDRLEMNYLGGLQPISSLTFMYEGSARPG